MCLSAPKPSLSSVSVSFGGFLADSISRRVSLLEETDLDFGGSAYSELPVLIESASLSSAVLCDSSVGDVIWLGVHGPS